MNQDFTVQKKQYLSEKKNFVQRGSPEKKIPARAVSKKKKFVQAENSPPPPPHHFSNGPSLTLYVKFVKNCENTQLSIFARFIAISTTVNTRI